MLIRTRKLTYVIINSNNEMLGAQIASIHNLGFYLWLVKEARNRILMEHLQEWKNEMVENITRRL
jgi:queuine tRNA-ribosyltransferase